MADKDGSVLVIDDDAGVRQSLRLCLEQEWGRVVGVESSAGALGALAHQPFDVALLDLWLGEENGLDLLPELLRRGVGGVIVITAFSTVESAVRALKLGATDYLCKPFSPNEVRAAVRTVRPKQVAQRDTANLRESKSPAFQTLLDRAERAARSDCPVLLRGESGTGKNVLAHWVHSTSSRHAGPFVSVNCPALTGDLMASTLFGHRRGAFTGAVADADGKVQEAHGGTLFLDEVGDLTLDAQARLLRFLHDQVYERVGEATERRADVRIVAATNQDLEARVASGAFREDLLYRLDVVSLVLPPLRERREDIVPLAERWLLAECGKAGRGNLAFSPASLTALGAAPWPGNLRQLAHAIRRAVILSPGPTLEPEDLGLSREQATHTLVLGSDAPLEDIEREHIARLLARTPSLNAAARTLQIDPTTLMRKRRRYGLT